MDLEISQVRMRALPIMSASGSGQALLPSAEGETRPMIIVCHCGLTRRVSDCPCGTESLAMQLARAFAQIALRHPLKSEPAAPSEPNTAPVQK